MEFVALCAALWVCFHLGAGTVAQRLPGALFVGLPVVSRTYGWERGGRVYRRLGIRWWKDRLPEAGGFLEGGFPKRRLAGDDPDYLARFALETSRAEFSHWLTWALSLTFFAWTPWWIGVVMIGYGAAANLPCILVQRYNRPRLRQAVARSSRGPHRDGAPLPGHAVDHQGEIE